ncbi:MAG: hypothetical protein HND48_02810 [Chloroflexi bacterium]|nr:hypothetical protein [Chloroflexota bacterium]
MTVSVIHQIYMLFGLLGDPVRVMHTEVWRQGMSISALIEFPGQVHCTLNWHNLPYLNDYRETYSLAGNRQRLRLEFPGPYYRNLPTPVVLQGGAGGCRGRNVSRCLIVRRSIMNCSRLRAPSAPASAPPERSMTRCAMHSSSRTSCAPSHERRWRRTVFTPISHPLDPALKHP